jgi:hypothetical protein
MMGVELTLNLAGIPVGVLEALPPGCPAKDRRADRQWRRD